MRLKIHEYQVVLADRDFMEILGTNKSRRDELDSEVSLIKAEIEGFREFKILSHDVRSAILRGRKGETLSQAQIVERRQLNQKQFTADYKYLSSHVHSDAFAVFDLMIGGKAGGPMTEETRERLVTMMQEATSYLAITLLDMTTLFPQFKLTDEGLKKAESFVARLR